MFAPQTSPASPAVLLSHKQKFMGFASIRDVLPLPVNLFPVYRWVFAVSKMLNFVTLGCCSDASRVGQRPQPLYRNTLATPLRCIAAPIPPCLRTAGFLGESR